MRHTLPALLPTDDCFVVFIDAPLLPLIAGKLCILEEERLWVQADYEAAYNKILEIEASMATMCASELVESNNRIYRLLDWSLNGVVYNAGADPPGTITPAIPAVPSEDTAEPGLVRELFKVRNLLDNALNGDINMDYTNPVSLRDQLQSIIDALAADDADIEGILESLQAIALLLA